MTSGVEFRTQKQLRKYGTLVYDRGGMSDEEERRKCLMNEAGKNCYFIKLDSLPIIIYKSAEDGLIKGFNVSQCYKNFW